MPPGRPQSVWLRLPRLVYWAVGAAISFGAAAGARLFANTMPPSERVPIWLIGAVFVFVGLAILSLGTKGRKEVEELFAETNGEQANVEDNGPPPL